MHTETRFIERLSQLVATPSVSCTQASLDTSNQLVVALLANWLDTLGFDCQILPIEGSPNKVNLIASKGTGPGGLVLAGHTDTVPCNPDRWQQNPYDLINKDQRFYGLGATDMKGFFPVALAAIESISDMLDHLQQPLIILATADEESSMSGARALAEIGKPKARYAVIGEPTGMTPIYMHKGIMMEKIRIQGVAGHSSDPSLGRSALESMHQVMSELLRFRAQLQDQYRDGGFTIDVPTLNLGCIHGGDNPNRICSHSELEFDLRPLPGMNIDDLHQQIHALLKPIQDRHQTPIDYQHLFPGVPAFKQARNSSLVRAAEKFTGFDAQAVAFATEAPFLQSLGMETIVMGPGSINQAHQPNEFLAHDQINPAIRVISELIGKYCIQAS